MQDMSKYSQLTVTEVMAAQVRETKTSEEESLFDKFVMAKVFKSLYKSAAPCFISKELNLELSFLRQNLSNPSKYAWVSPITHHISKLHDCQFYSDAYLYVILFISETPSTDKT